MLTFHPVHALRPKAPALGDIAAAMRACAETIRPVLDRIPPGAPVAVTVGSRGIDRIAEVTRELCLILRESGCRPFIVPAMGSHGGATAEGQRSLLAHYGISEQQTGCPVVSSMETVSLGCTSEGIEVFMDRAAWEAGRVVALNRVKPHTDFEGAVESGLLKIMAVGLGKRDGAESFHRRALRSGFESTLVEMARHMLATGRVIAGVGLVENDRHELCRISSSPASGLEQLDRGLQEMAKRLYPRLPFSKLDLLIVDELGKNISGAGMDAKVIGRPVHTEPNGITAGIVVRRIYTRDLTPESEGNALGIGFADLIHERLARKIDFQKMYTNSQTALAPMLARMPMHFPTDRRALEFLHLNLGSPDPADLRAAWIRNTLSLETFSATPSCVRELASHADYEVGEAEELKFDEAGDFLQGSRSSSRTGGETA
jgi:hypothetical protein